MTAAPHTQCQPEAAPVRQHTPTLVMGHIVCIGPDDEEAIPYDEAVIHLEGDEDSEIRINCPAALRLAPIIVEAVNSHATLQARVEELTKALEEIAGKNDLSKVAPEDEASAAFGALHECELIARGALAVPLEDRK